MCYSQQVIQDYRRYLRDYGVRLELKEFFEIFYRRRHGGKVSISKAMEDAFLSSSGEEFAEIQSLIKSYREEEALRLEAEIFEQRTRLVEAERKLQVKVTKGAAENKRIAGNKIEQRLQWLADLRRQEPKERDSRIFPGWYALVMVIENGERKILPMRYQCRPAGKPAFIDVKLPGLYNARRNSLSSFWRDLWGHSHGIVVGYAFYEHVNRHRAEGRELQPGEEVQDVILEFRPRPAQEMHVACLWSRWTAPGEPDLLSFAAITDEPPPEVAAAGHDRCIIPINPVNIEAWLTPEGRSLDALDAILEDRARPYYEHRLAA